MILGFRDRWLEDFFVLDRPSRNLPSDLEPRLFRKLQLLDDAASDSDLRVPSSNHFEELKGDLAGWHSLQVSVQWRLIFQWNGSSGEAAKVYLDNHDYR
jgi:proteic killer suppression protein